MSQDDFNDKSQLIEDEITELCHNWRLMWRDIFVNGKDSIFYYALFEIISLLFLKSRFILSYGDTLFRARIMSLEDIRESDKRIMSDRSTPFRGFDAKNSYIPEGSQSHGSRVSNKSLRCLYTADNCKTAQAEVRPHKGDIVSIAQIQVVSSVVLADASNLQSNSISELWYRFLITRSFSQPVEDHDDYRFPQVLSELLKINGFDGIRYSSTTSVGGHNIAIFRPEKCEPVNSDRYEVEQDYIKPKDIENILEDIYPFFETCITNELVNKRRKNKRIEK